MRRNRNASALVIVLCAALYLCACSSENKEEHRTDAEKKIEEPVEIKEKEYQEKLDVIEPSAYGNVSGLNLEKGSYISIIGKGKDGEYWEQVKKGAEQAASDINEKLNYEGKDEVKVTYSGPSVTDSVDEQVNILDEELARYPVGLSISIVDSQACGVQFDLAASNGIPIVAFDSGSDYQGLMATVSTDNRRTAQTAAEKMAELMNQKGELIVLVQDSKSMSAAEREKGFIEKIKADYPDIVISDVYHLDQMEKLKKAVIKQKKGKEKEDITEEDITEEEMIDYMMEKHPNLNGIFAADGTTVDVALDALERSKKENITLVGYDGNKEEIEALKDGRIDGLVIQNPFGMGYAAVVASARAALSMGNEAYIDTGAVWVTKDNLDSSEVKKWLY